VEVQEQANPGSADLQVADYLRNVHGKEPFNGFDLQDDLPLNK
jgi:hypothetical protein